ncbi:MAG: virulence protein RhuM/Fic/DOC family protein [Bacteroidetes bacterium]|nr:virulence protein RhuM/Fic/DOC family protein [Bacteroidota bacterium]MBU2586265.1 virulence protein RhuM/Fic/DOC family protein [Bacteroidota bacterium]
MTGFKGEIVIYRTNDGRVKLDVKLERETVWLNQSQLAKLFDRDQSVISRHIKNIFKEQELDDKSNMQFLHIPKSDKPVAFFNLDVIISLGYRVKSQRGTQFRIWANKVLKDYLIKGYAIYEKRLMEKAERVKELEQTLKIFSKVVESYHLEKDEFAGILTVISNYTLALNLLDQYDKQELVVEKTTQKEKFKLTYEGAIKVVNGLREKFGGSNLFGREKDKSFRGTLGAIYQTFNRKDLYPSIEEKAANLLYLTIKNHSFVDGNKRIAAALFLWFLDRNKLLYNKKGYKRIADNALVALCLMMAESKPKDKEIIIKVVVNLINKNN